MKKNSEHSGGVGMFGWLRKDREISEFVEILHLLIEVVIKTHEILYLRLCVHSMKTLSK